MHKEQYKGKETGMEIIAGTKDFEWTCETAVAMGKFDGIHVGHKRLLEHILECRKSGLKACVFTFDPTPSVLFGLSDGKELSTLTEKRAAFERMGVDILVEFPLTKETAAIPAEEFLREYLCERMHAKLIAAGEDVSFGKFGSGNAALLEACKDTYQYDLCLIEKVCVNGEPVSSTRIRGAVEAGEMEEAARLLGSPYQVGGLVESGAGLGHTIGFPTANLMPGPSKLLPPKGVYFSRALVNGRWHAAISNIGCKPTVNRDKAIGVETYLYDFDEDIYGAEMTVELLRFVRPERRFAGVEELKKTVHENLLQGAEYHGKL